MKPSPHGHAWVIDGDLYYSPNCSRNPSVPKSPAEPVVFKPCLSTVASYQEARWWGPTTEWMAFVPKQPVPYSGAWLESLNMIPKELERRPAGYMLEGALANSWRVSECLILDVARILTVSNKFVYVSPFAPHQWKYDAIHPSQDVAMKHIEAGRDWFSMWIGLVYWLTKKVADSSAFPQGLCAPQWFTQVVRELPNEQARWDMIRKAPIMQSKWKWNRVGLWLNDPTAAPDQPSAKWFVDAGIPVWYRWDTRNRSSTELKAMNQFLIAPPPEALQLATTWITPPSSPPTSTAILLYIHEHSVLIGSTSPSPTSISSSYRDFSQTSLVLGLASSDTESLADFSDVASGSSSPCQDRCKRSEIEWMEFWDDRAKGTARVLKEEPLLMRVARTWRELRPPSLSANFIYAWSWDDSNFNRNASHFTPSPVQRDERGAVLMAFKGQTLKYDSFFNEWHCCRSWDDSGLNKPGSEAREKSAQPPAPGHCLLPAPPNAESELLSASTATSPNLKALYSVDSVQQEILRLLSRHFGFIPPLPLPATTTPTTTTSSCAINAHAVDKKSFIATLGIETEPIALEEFLDTPLGRVCLDFLRTFHVKGTAAPKPPPDLWDLSEGNRQSLACSKRLKAIRVVKSSEKDWFMFDFRESRTVPWNLAVCSARAALYICRLDDVLTEADIAVVLAMEGVRFHTLQRRDTLGKAKPDYSAVSTVVSMRLSGHAFSSYDYNSYMNQCSGIMSLSRSRAAIMRGGFARRVALQYKSISEVTQGPGGIREDPNHMFVAWDQDGLEYVDNDLTPDELDVLCGLYITYTGTQTGKLSWYPLPSGFEGSGEDMGWWTARAETLWNTCRDMSFPGRTHQPATSGTGSRSSTAKKMNLPMNAMRWRDKLRGFGDGRRAQQRVEIYANNFIRNRIEFQEFNESPSALWNST